MAMPEHRKAVETRSIAVLHNPKSGARHAVELIDRLLEEMRSRGWKPESFTDLDAFQSRVAKLSSDGSLRAVVAAGGDGTASAVASRIGSDVGLRIFPLGTENLLSKYFQFNSDPVTTADSIDRMSTRQIDAATANGKLFLILAGIGFDAEVVRRIHCNRKGHIRRWHYWWHIAMSTLHYRFPKFRVFSLDSSPANSPSDTLGPTDDRDVSWLFVQNMPCYADGLSIASEAMESDGLLNVSTFRQGGLLNGLRYLLAVRLRSHRSLRDFQTFEMKDFRVEAVGSLEGANETIAASYQIDGDWGGYLPVDFKILPERVRIIL